VNPLILEDEPKKLNRGNPIERKGAKEQGRKEGYFFASLHLRVFAFFPVLLPCG
jgi:hypothetical protein